MKILYRVFYMSSIDGYCTLYFCEQKELQISYYTFDYRCDNMLFVIFCELDKLLCRYSKYGCHIRINDSTMFGIYVFCY